VGIQPAAIALGTELSPAVSASVPVLLATIAGHLAAWQVEDGASLAG
jgi:Ni,Fe-hydrogenase maturation factor